MHYASLGAVGDNAFLPSNYAIAGYAIFAAMLFDMFDGFVARLTRSASDFGAELDSLADMVSFGAAPAFLALSLIGNSPRVEAYMPGPFPTMSGAASSG